MTSAPTVRFLDRTTPPHISTLILLAGVSALNMSIFLPSLNKMTAYFETDYAVMQLALSGYLAATAILQIIVGPLADRFGRRKVVLVSLAIFAFASFGALISPNITTFLVFRMLQATVATGIVLSRAIVRDMVPQNQAASMIGYVTMGMSIVPMVGPMIGGALDQIFGWHATFVLLTLAGIAVWLLCYLDQGETVAGGGVSFADQMRGYPELLTSPRFWGYSICAAFASGAFFALLGGASFVSGTVFGLSPLWSGIALGAPAIGYGLGNFLSGRYSVQLGINSMALLGSLVLVVGLGISLLISLLGFQHPFTFFGFCTLLGLGNGMVLPNVMAGSLSVRPHLAGTASGLSGAIMIGGGAALSAVAGTLLSEDATALPLQWIMFASAIGTLLSIIYVIVRSRQISA